MITMGRDDSVCGLDSLRKGGLTIRSAAGPRNVFLGQASREVPGLNGLVDLKRERLVCAFLKGKCMSTITTRRRSVIRCVGSCSTDFHVLRSPLVIIKVNITFTGRSSEKVYRRVSRALRRVHRSNASLGVVGGCLSSPRGCLRISGLKC